MKKPRPFFSSEGPATRRCGLICVMGFRFWLPMLQTAAMLTVMWAPWAPRAHEVDVVRANGTEFKIWTLIPGPNALDWAEGLNLPASAVVTPAEFAIRKNDAPPNSKVRFFGFWLVGLLCWCMAGRCADDFLRWRRSGQLPRKHTGDLVFALLAVPSSALLAGVFLFSGEAPVLSVWGATWLVTSCLALAFRLLQLVRQRSTVAVS